MAFCGHTLLMVGRKALAIMLSVKLELGYFYISSNNCNSKKTFQGIIIVVKKRF